MRFREFLMMEGVAEENLPHLITEVRRLLAFPTLPPVKILTDSIYRFLAKKHTPAISDAVKGQFKSHAQDYLNLVWGLKLPSGIQIKPGSSGWVALDMEDSPRRQQDVVGRSRVDHKFYVSYDPNTWEDIERFVSAIPDLALRLRIIARENKDHIALKFALRVETFVSHSDTLVIYYRDVKNGSKIEMVVSAWLMAHKLSQGKRGVRAEGGFDLHPDEQHGEPASHTQLVAHWLADKIIKEAASIRSMSDTSLGYWLRSTLYEANIRKPHEMEKLRPTLSWH